MMLWEIPSNRHWLNHPTGKFYRFGFSSHVSNFDISNECAVILKTFMILRWSIHLIRPWAILWNGCVWSWFFYQSFTLFKARRRRRWTITTSFKLTKKHHKRMWGKLTITRWLIFRCWTKNLLQDCLPQTSHSISPRYPLIFMKKVLTG